MEMKTLDRVNFNRNEFDAGQEDNKSKITNGSSVP